ncbi:hypothetical protein TNCV_876202 [Trichonephila clavipes]|nr:hypothetical protein TNCV_876202 [Trichonephila clavipes]
MWHTPSSGSEVSVRFYGRQISTLLDFYPMGQSQGPGVSRRCDYTNGFSCLSACCMYSTSGIFCVLPTRNLAVQSLGAILWTPGRMIPFKV